MKREMNIRKVTPERDVAHEYGHRFEAEGPFKIHDLCKDFLLDRSNNGSNARKKVRKLCNNKKYKSEEIAFEGTGFADNYMAKIYENVEGNNHFNATEIMSMGIEGLYFNRYDMWEKDAKSIDFILGIMVSK
jgi:hypothetical protein